MPEYRFRRGPRRFRLRKWRSSIANWRSWSNSTSLQDMGHLLFLYGRVDRRPEFLQPRSGFRGAQQQAICCQSFAERRPCFCPAVSGEPVSLGPHDEKTAIRVLKKSDKLRIARLRRNTAVHETKAER